MDILIAVDGTGTDNDADYKAEFGDPGALYCSPNQSHVFTMHQSWHHQKTKWYSRGPTMMGLTTHNLAASAARAAIHMYKPGADRLFLAGYSRGGASVLQAATLLYLRKIPVHAMFLYDAVDRAAGIVAADTIPPNVKQCFHALRDPKARSRVYFGNCGLHASPGVDLRPKSFVGTHGALGGMPWSASNAGSDGLINEHGEVTELVSGAARTLTKGVAALAAVAAGPVGLVMAGTIISSTSLIAGVAARNSLTTTITPEQDMMTARAVGQWMTNNLVEVLRRNHGKPGA